MILSDLKLMKLDKAYKSLTTGYNTLNNEYNVLSNSIPPNNYNGLAAPTKNNDTLQGYKVGSLWSYGNKVYQCVENVAGSAQWEIIARKDVFFYNAGDNCTDLTGGWDYERSGIGSTTFADYYHNADNMEANISGGTISKSPCTINQIDLSKYKTINMDLEVITTSNTNQLVQLGVLANRNVDLNVTYAQIYSGSTVGRYIVTLDVTYLTQMAFIRIVNYANGSGYIHDKIHAVWGEVI
jgi:hypothetical protein